MLFSKLSEYFEKLEITASRLELIDILSELFKKTGMADIDRIIYLSQGRVAPFFAPIEIGMADKTVADAIGRVFGHTKENILVLYGRLGDMGLVAQQLRSKIKDQRSKMTVEDVFNTLIQIAKTSGKGTVEKRVGLLSELLKEFDPISVKHLVRMALGRTRLGIGDPTILDALALALLGDRTKRKLLEKAYNETSDLGLIGKTLLDGGLEAVQKLGVTVGRPIRSELCERLPNPEKVFEKMSEGGGGVHVTYKYDGFRCVTGYTPVYVKNKGTTAIRDIQVGDRVLTRTGTFKSVIEKKKRTIRRGEKLFRFKTFLGEEVKISEGHPVLCFYREKEVWRNVEKIKPGDEVVFSLPQFPPNNPHSAPEKLELQTLSGYKKTFTLNENFYRFLGFWIGDGFTNDFHNAERVGLTFNAQKEAALADFYEAIIKQDLQVHRVARYSNNGGLNLYWRDEPLKHWLSTYFRREWLGKMLPEWFVHVSKDSFEQFLQGWIESDGTTQKSGTTYITTKERDLAAFAQMIALSHGIIVGLHYLRIKSKTYYQLVIPKTKYKAWIDGNRLIVKVKYVEEIKYRDPRIQLYDIQVEGDESFCVPMATLHNCQIHKKGQEVRIFSRNLEEMTHMFPELIKGTREQVKAKTAILDSEAMAYQPESEEFLPFQETTKRRRKYNIEEMSKSLPLRAFVFDILYADGKSLLETPLVERMEKLQEVIEKDDTLIPSTGEILTSPKDLQLMLDDAISKGLEGVVVKRVDSKYEAGGRNFNWVKLKRHSAGELQDTIDCVILGYVYGRGKRTAFGAGALLVGVYDSEKDEFVTVSKIGTGLTDEEWRSIILRTKNLERKNKPARVSSSIVPSVWVTPEIVIEVLADEITRSPIHTAGAVLDNGIKIPGYALRFPRLVSFRDKDKKAEDATSVAELIEMYEQQGKR